MYGKAFAQMYTGSMLGAGTHVFAVWGYCIANASADGHVELNTKLLAVLLGASEELVVAAIDYLTSPDPNSRTQGSDGRRLIREGQFLYRIVNYAKYRDTRDDDARREYQRRWARERRQAARCESGQVDSPTPSDSTEQASTDVDTCRQASTGVDSVDKRRQTSTQVEVEVEVEAEVTNQQITTTTTSAGACAGARPKASLSEDMRDKILDLVESWQAIGGKPVPATGHLAVLRALSGLLQAGDNRRELTWVEILEAVRNYGEARKVPNTQAHDHSLVGFLRWEIISRYGPGAFNLTNYRADRFAQRDGPPRKSAEERVADLKAKGHLP